MILPSLLEYSRIDIQNKLQLIKGNLELYSGLTHQNTTDNRIHLHLDFVLKRFAQDRLVMTSLLPKSVFEELNTCFKNQRLDLSLHFMGEVEDLIEQYTFLQRYQNNPLWQYTLFVPNKFYSAWKETFENKSNTVGIWHDLETWESVDFEPGVDYLLMTVRAGKSGQKPLSSSKQKTLAIAKSNPESRFIVDGGWQIDEDPKLPNLSVVSYSSFWNSFASNT